MLKNATLKKPNGAPTEQLSRHKKTSAEMGPGDHVCWVYETDEQFRAMVTPFLCQGLEQDEKVIYIVDELSAERVLSYLRNEEVTVEPYLASGQLRILGVEKTYMRTGALDPDDMIELLRNETECALNEEYSALRVISEMSWTCRRLPGFEKLVAYEAKLSDFIQSSKCLAICQYNMRIFDPAVLIDVLCTHPLCIVGTELYENPYYIPPADILSPDLPSAKLRNWLDNLAELNRTDQALSTLAGGIAHNFNNLNMGIRGNTALMLFGTDPVHPNYKKLKTIEKLVQKGSRLITQLLGYAGEGRYEIKHIGLNQIVREALNIFDDTTKRIRIHLKLADDLFDIMADHGQMEQVLLNLFGNALDAMPQGGDLYVGTMNLTHEKMIGKPYKPKPGNYILLTVTDTGVGIDKNAMKHMFEPFFSTKGVGKGMGLGLASVYGIVKAQGGYIDVYSKNGHGTTLKVYLPASEKQAAKGKKLATELFKLKRRRSKIDDESMIPKVPAQILGNKRHGSSEEQYTDT
jgi:nitrogen-specific signal transduction histidine kinase